MEDFIGKTIVVMCLTVALYVFLQTVNIYLLCDDTQREYICENIVKTGVKVSPPWEQELDFNAFDNETGTYDGRYIVPNFVHFSHFGQNRFDVYRAVCIMSAIKNQRPEKLFILTDQESFRGRYWSIMMNTSGFRNVLVIRKMDLPTRIFGHQLRPEWKYYHGGDVARIKILMKYGGIYLDTDTYIVRSLDDFRRFEMALPWRPGNDISNQILVAHKNARFLRLWYNSYKFKYRNYSWSYNGGQYPGQHILPYQPEVVHRVHNLLGVYGTHLQLFRMNYPEWRDYYTIHLGFTRVKFWNSHGLIGFEGKSIFHQKAVFLELCKAVFPFLKSSKEND